MNTEIKQLKDNELLENFGAGDLIAFDEILNRYESRIKNYLYQYTGDTGLSADVTQECFIKLYEYRQRILEIANLSSWLFTIAANMVKRDYKKVKGMNFISFEEMNEDEIDRIDFDDESNNDDRFEENEIKLEQIKEALAKTYSEFREVILLRYTEGYSYEQISEILKIPSGTVKSRINRGRQQMIEYIRKINITNKVQIKDHEK